MKKTIKCPICGTENRVGVKYCRICFSRMISTTNLPLKTKLDKTSFYPYVAKHKNLLGLVLIILLLIILWFLLK